MEATSREDWPGLAVRENVRTGAENAAAEEQTPAPGQEGDNRDPHLRHEERVNKTGGEG